EFDIVGLAITSPEKGWLKINQCLCDMLEYSAQELNRLTWSELTHPDDLAADVEQFNKLLANEINGYSLEKRFISKSGRFIPSLLVVRCVRKDDGAVDYVTAMVQDLTERKKSEATLLANEERMRAFFDNVPLGIFSSSRDGKFTYVNPALPTILGYDSREEIMEVVNRTSVAETLYAEPPRRLEIMRELDQDYSHWKTFENRYRRKDGQIIDAIVSIGERQNTTTKEIFFDGIVSDITERKKMEAIQSFLAKTTSSTLGESFFEELARYLSQSLDMFYVCIDRLEGDGLNATTLAIWCDDKFEDNVTYALKDTPCGDVVGQKVCCFPANVCQHFPHDQMLQDLCAESYIGVTLFGHIGQPIGLIAVIGRAPLANRPLAESILKLVAMRAAGELERLFAEEEIQLSANVFFHSREGILITEADGTIAQVNEAFTRITGYRREEVVGKNPRILSSGRHSKEFYATFWLELSEKGYWTGEVWNRRKNGEVYVELLTVSAVRSTKMEGKTLHYVALFSDISALKEHQHQLEHIAHFDTLTNLPNRVLLADRLRQGMTQAHRHNQTLAVVFLDLDGFKAVNDLHGHAVGDQLLLILATRMKHTLREGDTLARIGGDEFVAVLLDLIDIESCVPMLNRLLTAVAEPVHIGSLMLMVSASLGVTFHPQTEDIDADQLLRQADQAMYQAKVSGKNRYQIFDATLDSKLRVHYESLERIRLALTKGELVLHYQPKVNMRSGKVIGVEALIRWQHPERGLLVPATFLPVIEDHPLAVAVGEWVIDTALTQIEVWHAVGTDLPVSVNIGARQLQQKDFVMRLQAILASHPQVNPASLELEVLETSALADTVQVSQVIESCAKIGVKFALDDFGTGYSSLTYLRRLRVALLKIDKSFVRDMLVSPDDLAILQGVISLAGAFKCEVIAEGVETVAHGTLLLQMGCELAQGYGIAWPMPAAQMPDWVTNWQPDSAWSALA
ncbi:MAG: EAL domain-containing protein, partial [Comamonadaceae bacterium]